MPGRVGSTQYEHCKGLINYDSGLKLGNSRKRNIYFTSFFKITIFRTFGLCCQPNTYSLLHLYVDMPLRWYTAVRLKFEYNLNDAHMRAPFCVASLRQYMLRPLPNPHHTRLPSSRFCSRRQRNNEPSRFRPTALVHIMIIQVRTHIRRPCSFVLLAFNEGCTQGK